VEGYQGIRILNRFVPNYSPPTTENPEGFFRIIKLPPRPQPECTEQDIEDALNILDNTPDILDAGKYRMGPQKRQDTNTQTKRPYGQPNMPARS
jgi:hypothetical protein